VFLKCAASRGARKSALTEVVPARYDGRVGPQRSVVERRRSGFEMSTARCELRRGKTATQGLQHKTCNTRPCEASAIDGGATHARIEAGGLNVPRQPRHAECCAILGINSPA
jgi:hypothetical protein